jgi:hypothetical protein
VARWKTCRMMSDGFLLICTSSPSTYIYNGYIILYTMYNYDIYIYMCVIYIHNSIITSLRKGTIFLRPWGAATAAWRRSSSESCRSPLRSPSVPVGQLGAVQKMLETRHGKHTKNDGKNTSFNGKTHVNHNFK